ncbi:activator of HSP90 ATPase [Sphingobacteriaceae bacterium]|nr:activator of HSP90 ATPase [Sphingobacteriaceae bacterium]
MTKHLSVSKIFDAPVEDVWQIWTDAGLLKLWWGPDKFICDIAQVDFRVGGTTLINMKAPQAFGGAEHFSTWTYTKIDLYESIEYIQNLADKQGVKQKPTAVGMPADFPEDIRTLVTFKRISENTTEMTVNEYADFGQTSHFAKIGLEQCFEKIAKIFADRKTQ